MATNVDDTIEIIGHHSGGSIEWLRSLWHVENLRIAQDESGFWLKGISLEVLQLPATRSITNLKWFEQRENLLFTFGNKVPDCKLPNGLLWSPIQHVIRLQLPSFNENLFEVHGELTIEFIPSSVEQTTAASIVSLADLRTYINTVPQFEYHSSVWCKLGEDKALIIGNVILSIPSKRFWIDDELLIPVGNDFKYSYMKQIFRESNRLDEVFWLFHEDASYSSISKKILVPLTRASVKSTIEK